MIDKPTGRRVGRPPLTDQDSLLAAARQLGFARLTVGSVTTAVGVKYSTFYRHFPRLDVLVTTLADQVCAELALPAPEQAWQDTIRTTSAAVREMLEQHPGMAEALIALPQLPDGVLAIATRLTDTLLHAGFGNEIAAGAAVYAVETVMSTQLCTAGLHHALTKPEPADATGGGDSVVRRSSLRPVADLIERPNGAWTGHKIDLLIYGLEAAHAKHRGSNATPDERR